LKEYKASTQLFGFQKIEDSEVEEKSLNLYQQVMHNFFAKKNLIP